MALLFVYGTLKEGFCNFKLNEGRRIPGDFVTVELFQLYVLGPFSLPWMIEADGHGFQVKGQLYEVTEEQLSQLDRFERVHEPGWLTRKPILVRARGSKAKGCAGSRRRSAGISTRMATRSFGANSGSR